MDKFEQVIHDVGKMPESEQNKAIDDYKGSCICPTCPLGINVLKMSMKNFSV
jgi:hypothetical protein